MILLQQVQKVGRITDTITKDAVVSENYGCPALIEVPPRCIVVQSSLSCYNNTIQLDP